MPTNKKKRLTDVLSIRGRTVTDGTNNSNQNKARANADFYDSKLGKTPRNVSPDMHSYFEEDRKRNPPKKPRRGWKATGDLV
jgi:hypothetical protein